MPSPPANRKLCDLRSPQALNGYEFANSEAYKVRLEQIRDAQEAMIKQDLTTMWRWLRTETLVLDIGPTYAIHPDAFTVRAWLHSKKQAAEHGQVRAG
jgi:hypothetical protein